MKFDYRALSYLIPFSNFTYPINWTEVFDSDKPINVEIGFGLGEVLVDNIQNNRGENYVGIEQNWERIYRCIKSAIQTGDKLPNNNNLRILKSDARHVFRWLFAEKSVNSIYCLFPCPWPKKGHVKHRLFSTDFLNLLNNRLVDGGALRIVTDYYLYHQWVEEQAASTGFILEKKAIGPQFNTKFEKKWIQEGQKKFFEIYLSKKTHYQLSESKKANMKAYRLKECNLENIIIEDLKGATTVICKDIIVDQSQQKALIHLVVSEESLTQHFWVIIIKEKNIWRLNKAEGQTFFPTPGIALALEHVYKQVSE